MTDIDRLANTGELLLEKITSYLNEDIPVIVENATESWPDRGLIDVVDLKKVWLLIYEPRLEKTVFLHMRKQRRRSASR